MNPMDTSEIREIEIEATRTDCKLDPKKYYVKKTRSTDEEESSSTEEDSQPGEENTAVYFFAALSPEFIKVSKLLETPSNHYEQQAGYIFCSKGYIEDVRVYGDGDPIDARNCGMGTVLSSLCMNDGELNLMSASKIDKKFRNNNKVASTVKKGCKKFIGLTMVAIPPKGAYAYFSAAISSGYNRMLIKIDSSTFKWMDTEKARSCYDKTTGQFGEAEHPKIEGHGKAWYFCDDIPGKFPKFPSTDQCFLDSDQLPEPL